MERLTQTQRGWLSERFKDQVQFNASLSFCTSFQIGGPAEALVTPKSREELVALVVGARNRQMGYRILGGGTNLLIPDQGLLGLVIRMTRCLDTIGTFEEISGQFRVSVGASVPLKRFCRYCIYQGFNGMNFAIGIPGTVGGALMMNAGTGSGSMADSLLAINVLMGNGDVRTISREALQPEYRRLSWRVSGEEHEADFPSVILDGEFLFGPGNVADLKIEARRIMNSRKKNQPLGCHSAGCIFKNPLVGPPAGRLIDLAGLKGRRQGDAVISEQHANFIVNTGNATASDVLALMCLMKQTVWNRFQIELEPEVKVVRD